MHPNKNTVFTSSAFFDRHFLCFYLLLALLFAGGLLVPGNSLYRWDTLVHNWPFVLEMRESMDSGHFPFWSSAICCGTPLLENINAGVLYPPRILCWIMPLRPGYHLFLFFHVWLSFVGIHILLRKGFDTSRCAAFIGALAYAASGYARGMWDTHNFVALPWIPLGLAALLLARRPGKQTWSIVLTALCWCMLILGGDIQAAMLWLPAAGLLVLFHPSRKRIFPTLIKATVLTLLLSAPQWFPSLLYYPETYRFSGLEHAESVERSFNPLRLLELFVPYVFGNRDAWYGQSLAGEGAKKILPWTCSFHIGIVGLLAAAFALRKRKHWSFCWAALLLTGSLLLSFGRFMPGYEWWTGLPLVRGLRFPEKYLLWSNLALAVIAGLGYSALSAVWTHNNFKLLRIRTAVIWCVCVAIISAALIAVGLRMCPANPRFHLWLAGRVISSILICLLLFVSAVIPGRKRSTGWMLPALMVTGLLFHWHTEQPLTSRFDPLDPPAIAQVVTQSDAPRGRVLRDLNLETVPLPPYFGKLRASEKTAVWQREALVYNSPALWGMRTPLGYSPLVSRAIRQFQLGLLESCDASKPQAAQVLSEFCRQADVRWLLTSKDMTNALADAGLEFGETASWGAANEVTLLRLDNVAPTEISSASPPSGPLPEVLKLQRSYPGEIQIDLKPGAVCQLLIKEGYAPGWKAHDRTGQDLEIRTGVTPFISLSLPAETSRITLQYEPLGWNTGLACFAAGLLILFLLMRQAGRLSCH